MRESHSQARNFRNRDGTSPTNRKCLSLDRFAGDVERAQKDVEVLVMGVEVSVVLWDLE